MTSIFNIQHGLLQIGALIAIPDGDVTLQSYSLSADGDVRSSSSDMTIAARHLVGPCVYTSKESPIGRRVALPCYTTVILEDDAVVAEWLQLPIEKQRQVATGIVRVALTMFCAQHPDIDTQDHLDMFLEQPICIVSADLEDFCTVPPTIMPLPFSVAKAALNLID